MSLDVRLVRYGPNAFAALAHAVGAAKGGDPLQLVTVVVPRGPVGLAARRRLAAAPGGICNVRHITLARLAADLAVPWLAATGKRPRTRALEHEAVRAVLATHATGILATVRDQPATVQAVARTARELETASSRTLDALARRSPRSGEVVEVVRSVWARLGDRYGDAELLVAAVGELGRLADPGAATGPVVVHLPPRLGTAALGLVRALAGVVNVTILVGLTGRPSADRPAWAMAELLGAVAPSPDPAPD
ncbi:MAG: hypothetical protein ACRDYZ_07155, partial [Acidimicrobiales bacterium]